MKIIFISILVFIITLPFWSCNRSKEKQPAGKSVDYKTITFERKTGDCDFSSTPCAEIKFNYPQITYSANKQAITKINHNIINTLLAPYSEDKSFSNFDSMADDFLESFNEFKNEFPDMHQSWSIQRNISVENVNDSIFSVSNREYYYMGGAHPNSMTSFINFSMMTGEAIELSDLFKPGYENELYKAGEKIFREKQNLKPEESLNETGYWFDNDKFELNDNFLIKKKGLLFLFNPYEVAAYVFGAIEVFIPYKDIKNLFSSESLLKMYLNNN